MKRTTLIITLLATWAIAGAQLTLERCHQLARENWPLI